MYRILATLITVLVVAASYGNNLQFRTISPEGGLIYEGIKQITRDKTGVLWCSSNRGLFRYDGKNITQFTHSTDDTTSISSNWIYSIKLDQQDNLWIATNLGLDVFDQSSQSFIHIFPHSSKHETETNNIVSFDIDNDNNVWIVDDNGIGILNISHKSINYIDLPIAKNLKATRIYFDQWKRGWITFSNGEIHRLFPEDRKLIEVVKKPFPLITALHVEEDKIYVGYKLGGIRIYNLKGEIIKEYVDADDKKVKLYRINAIDVDKDGNIWSGGYYGLYKINTQDQITFHNQNNISGLPNNSIKSIYIDTENAIWVGTWSGGLAMCHPSDIFFEHYKNANCSGTLTNDVVTSFCESEDGKIYIGTEAGGLNRFNPESKKIEPVILSEKTNPVNIKSLAKDSLGGIWAGTHIHGAYYKPKNKTTFRAISLDDTNELNKAGNDVFGLHADNNGVWLSFYGKGIKYYDLHNDKVTNWHNILKNKKISGTRKNTTTFVDSKGNLWLNKVYGCVRVNLKDTSIVDFCIHSPERYRLPDSDVFCISELSNGEIWLGMESEGIRIYSYETDSITSLHLDDISKKLDIYGIIEDHNKNIWLTTNNGLIVIQKDKAKFKHFANDDNNIRQFLSRSVYKDSKDYLYFGGTNGFIRLKPSELKPNVLAPNSHIHNVLINNNKYIYTNSTGNSSISNYKTLKLQPDENTLQFEHYSSNLLQPEKNRYKYRLLNYSNNWVEINNTEKAIFTKIPSGKYTFELLTCNNDGVWQKTPTRLNIEIAFPWYRSTIAYIIYTLLALLLTLIFYKIYQGKQILKQRALIEKVKHENKERMHQLKLRFFTNISHEFRTPLTLIAGPIKELITSPGLSIQQQNYLNAINSNSNRMLHLIDQLMDFQKIEEQKEKIDLQNLELISFLKERFDNFTEEAQIKGLDYIFEPRDNAYYIDADPEKLDKIIYNLLSNAFKHVSDKGTIRLIIEQHQNTALSDYENRIEIGESTSNNTIAIRVENSGSGISNEDLKQIFKRFEQGNSMKYGSGIGLDLVNEYTLLHHGQIIVQSSVHKGTSFSILLPLWQNNVHPIKEITERPLLLPQEKKERLSDDPSAIFSRNNTVLIVDDNPEMLSFIESCLQNYYNTIVSNNGDDALKKLNAHEIDLIVSDVMMPQIDGFSFCKRVKSNLSTSHIPVVLITALSSKDSKLQGLQKGADAYLVKPFDKDILISQIENLLEQRRTLIERYQNSLPTLSESKTVSTPEYDNMEQFFLTKAKEIVLKNLQNENFSVELLAKELFLSRSQLHRKLKQLTNYSANDFIRIHKLNKAAHLLQHSDIPVNEVAFLTGFETHSWFSKCFKEFYKMSPNQYRKKMTTN